MSNRDTEPDPLNKRRTREDTSPPNVPNKKHRSASPIYAAVDTAHAPEDTTQTVCAAPIALPSPQGDGRKTALSWEDDPYEIDPGITLRLLNLYFAHVNNAVYCIFPRGHFLNWVKACSGKYQNERMLLYAMLAMASIFAEDELSGIGKECARIAEDALLNKVGRPHHTVAQTRMLVALYHHAKGAIELAWENSGSAIRTITYLRLNTEDGCWDDSEVTTQARFEFGFSRDQLAECKRRTFWAGFTMDRYCGATTCSIKPEDAFVRLPCTDDMYEQGMPSDAPYFGNEIIDPTAAIITASSPLAPMAWLVIVAATWGDVLDFLLRAPYRSPATYRDAYESFYGDIGNRLQGWSTRLPEHLQYNEANLDRSIQQGYAGTFISMHALYHFSLIKLNRCLRHSEVPAAVGRNIRTAHRHGHQVLQMMNALCHANRTILGHADGQPATYTFSTPFPGYVTLAAIDVVGAGGPDSNLKTTIDEIGAGLDCLRELSVYWNSAKEQERACRKRLLQIQKVTTGPIRTRSGAWLGSNWGQELSLESGITSEDDCIYGLGTSKEAIETYFGALKEDGEDSKAIGGLRIG